MKHFFFAYDEKLSERGVLNGLFTKFDLSWTNCENNLKILYDAADIIYDKRFEGQDEELKVLVDGASKNSASNRSGNTNKFYECLESFRDKPKKSEPKTEMREKQEIQGQSEKQGKRKKEEKQYRIQALKLLWRYMEAQYKCFETDCKTKKLSAEHVLYHLVRGNLCLRISQCFYENFDLNDSDIWGNTANEILWHGRNLAVAFRDSQQADKRIKAVLYFRLIKLNLAKHYRDYARRNRRSDFDAALHEFEYVMTRVDGDLETTDNPKIKRQYVLIWMDAYFNISKIHRKKYQIEISLDKMKSFYNCFEECLNGSRKENISKQNAGDPAVKEKEFLSKCLLLDDYDKKRYFLLAHIELSRLYRDLHSVGNYLKSMSMAIEADQWSRAMDQRPGYEPGHNIDAWITLSSSLRKYMKFKGDRKCIEDLLAKLLTDMTDGDHLLTLKDEKNKSDSCIQCSAENVQEPKETVSLCDFLSKLAEFADNGHLKSKTEIIKWHCLYLQYPNLLESIQDVVGDYDKNIKPYFQEKDLNLQLRFLKGLVFFRTGKYSKAIKIFKKLVSPDNKETQYIRLGTIGLKARYLLANCYMAQTEYSKAREILEYLRDTLSFAYNSRRNQNLNSGTDADPDARIEIDLGYCYMQQGTYAKAYDIYEKLYGDGNSADNPDFGLEKVKQERRIMGLNNYAACCILSVNDESGREIEKDIENNYVMTRLETARRIFRYLDTHFSGQEIDRETSLLKGYYTVCTGKAPSDERVTPEQITQCKKMFDPQNLVEQEAALAKAHGYFKEACGFDDAFTNRYTLQNDHGEIDKAKYRNEVERISAYAINLTRLYKLDRQKNGAASYAGIADDKMLKNFILNVPPTYQISLKAAIALAEWLLDYADTRIEEGTADQSPAGRNQEEEAVIKHLYRSFSYITIYEERGARVFNILKNDSTFRFFTAEQRGHVLALLLAMYKPVKAVKEDCCFNIRDQEESPHLVHYTSMNTMKKIMDEEKTEPHFRINNCGYMNDVFEGNTFLDCIRRIFGDESQALLQKYFPQTIRLHDNMLPTGSDVYIGSLSVNKDSFPMWDIYSKKESGCNIEFGPDFFDVDGIPYFPRALRDYMISKYTDQDYPLYIVQYITPEEFERCYQKYKEAETSIDVKTAYEIKETAGYRQFCGTEAIHYTDLIRLLQQIYHRWKQLDEYLEHEVDEENRTVIHAFAADRINEIRFLFKDSDYQFEGEVRIIYTDTQEDSAAKVDMMPDNPYVYVTIDRELKDLTVRLGSKIEDTTVDKYVTWLKHTNRVKRVELANRNRYTAQMPKKKRGLI